jgi:hypothetical protein
MDAKPFPFAMSADDDPLALFRPVVSSDPVPIKSPDTSLTEQWLAHTRRQTQRFSTVTEVTLPSGLKVKAVRPHLLLMYRNGVFPNALTPMITKLLSLATEGQDRAETEIMDQFQNNMAEAYTQFTLMLDYVWISAIVEPVFALDPANVPEDKLTILRRLPAELQFVIPLTEENVSIEDRLFFFNWCQGVDQTIESFREEQAARLEALEAKQNVANAPGDVVGTAPDPGQLAELPD